MNLNKTLSPLQAADQLDRYFRKLHAKRPDLPLQVRVHSGKLGWDYTFPGDSSGQPYHVASIGKLFTASLVMMLAERGAFTTRDPIHPFFSSAELERLFVFQGADYARQVTIEQLLGHTSGLADYFEGGVTGGRSFLDEVLANPQAHWTPQALLDFTREKQAAVGAPGQVFNYSDTGYILLGLLIEKVSGKAFHENLRDEFFVPLEMDNSYLMFYSKPTRTPTKALEEIWFNGVEISGFESLSCDWAGGGIVSTTQDLLKFSPRPAGGQAGAGGGAGKHGYLHAQVPAGHLLRAGDDGNPLQRILLFTGTPAEGKRAHRHPGDAPVLRPAPGSAYRAELRIE